jgi:methionyl-tRNA formyltransferase
MKYIFIGDRSYVLRRMIELKLEIVIVFIFKDSYLEKESQELGIDYVVFNKKKDLIGCIESIDFDILVSNGCPYILPVSKIKKDNQRFINVHPSLLPDLRGKSPINGAILYNREHGVTCHYMDDGIDTGEIIAQIEITKNPIGIELDLIYQITFFTEAEVFQIAYEKGFKIDNEIKQNPNKHLIYYSRSSDDLVITNEPIDAIIRKVLAFTIYPEKVWFLRFGKDYIIHSVKVIKDKQILNLYQNYKYNQICWIYDRKILVMYYTMLVMFELNDIISIKVGDYLFEHFVLD